MIRPLAAALMLIVVTSSPARASDPRSKTVTLKCNAPGSLGGTSAPAPGTSIVLDAVALPDAVELPADRHADNPAHARWFAKGGLFVKPGTAFELVVPQSWRDRASIGWGFNSGARYATRFIVTGCAARAADQDWLGFPGGYWVKSKSCVPLIVRTTDASQRVHVGVGAPCAS